MAGPQDLLKYLSLDNLKQLPSRIFSNQSNILSIGIIMVIGMLLIPLPPWLLDLAFVFNFAGALFILLISLNVDEPLEFSTFPTVLLLVTLARLALEIAATRSILLEAHAGEVVHAIGEFVVGGNFVVGIIIFLILFVVNFIVVTEGAGRVSEVAARFALDSMPGKQLAVDADLNAGLIDEATAKARRKAIASEADFYATMDGGSKFVKGDAIASIIIAVVNIVAGFIIGVLQLKLSAGDAAAQYTILTIGEGLASQIAALLISIATGIIITRSANDENSTFAENVGLQLFNRKEVFAVSSATMLLLGIGIKGAFFPFALVAFGLGYIAYKKYQEESLVYEEDVPLGADGKPLTAEEQLELENKERLKKKDEETTPEGVLKLLKIDQIEVEIGYKLIGLIDPKQDGDLMSRIGQIRKQVMMDLGLPVPAIRVHDNLQVSPTEYVVKLRGAPIAKGQVEPNSFLAIDTGLIDPTADPIQGTQTTEPSYGLSALWIAAADKDKAEMVGYTVATPSSVVATHLTEVIRNHAHEILSRADLLKMLDQVKDQNGNIVDEVHGLLSMGELLPVIQNLLREQISIRDLSSILEHIANFAKVNKDPDFLSERVRESMGRQICSEFLVDNKLNCVTFHPAIEEELMGALHIDRLALDPARTKVLIQNISKAYESVTELGLPAVLLCNAKIRLALRKILERTIPQMAVISYSEVPSSMDAGSAHMIADLEQIEAA